MRVGWSSETGQGVGFTTWKWGTHTFAFFPAAATAVVRGTALAVVGLLLLFVMIWFIPYVAPSALHRISSSRKM